MANSSVLKSKTLNQTLNQTIKKYTLNQKYIIVHEFISRWLKYYLIIFTQTDLVHDRADLRSVPL